MRRCPLAFKCVRNTAELSSLTSLTYLEFSEWGWTVPIAETHYPPPPYPPKKNTGCILGNCRVLIKVPRKMSLDPQTPPKRFLQGRTEKGGSRTFLLWEPTKHNCLLPLSLGRAPGRTKVLSARPLPAGRWGRGQRALDQKSDAGFRSCSIISHGQTTPSLGLSFLTHQESSSPR